MRLWRIELHGVYLTEWLAAFCLLGNNACRAMDTPVPSPAAIVLLVWTAGHVLLFTALTRLRSWTSGVLFVSGAAAGALVGIAAPGQCTYAYPLAFLIAGWGFVTTYALRAMRGPFVRWLYIDWMED